MFSRDDLRDYPVVCPPETIEVELVFVTQSWMEGEAVVHRQYRQWFTGPLHFWMNSQRLLEQTLPPHVRGWFLVAAEEALCEPADEAAIVGFLGECLQGDFFTAALKPLGEFRGGLWLLNEWCNRIAVAEFGERYYAAYWFTSG